MNFNSPVNYNQGLALLLSTIHNVNKTLLSSSTQEQPSFPFINVAASNNQTLFNKIFTKQEKSFSPLNQENLTTSPSSDHSLDGAKASMEEESEMGTNLHLKKPIFTITRQNKLSKSNSSDQEGTKATASATTNYNRKEKSLGELSKRFLGMFGRINECVISLDAVTKQLDVERRRVYDIINILESLGVVYRKGKNNYQWNGLEPIRKTIEKLELRKDVKQEESEKDDSSSDGDDVEQRLANKKEKSLAYLAGSFIKLFFTWKDTIPLEEAAWELSPADIEEHKIKTKVRRLYDIANVFSSLGLIKKICLDSKKPAFQWVGTPGLDELIERLHSSPKPSVSEKIVPKKSEKDEVKAQQKEEKSFDMPLIPEDSKANSVKTSEAPMSREDKFDNLINMLLNVCQEAQANSKLPYQNSVPHLYRQSNFNPNFGYPNFGFNQYAHFYQMQRDLEESRSFQRNTVPLIQKADFENQTTSDRRKLSGSDISAMNIKRPAVQNIQGFESRNTKKIHSIYPEKALLNFKASGNYAFGTQ